MVVGAIVIGSVAIATIAILIGVVLSGRAEDARAERAFCREQANGDRSERNLGMYLGARSGGLDALQTDEQGRQRIQQIRVGQGAPVGASAVAIGGAGGGMPALPAGGPVAPPVPRVTVRAADIQVDVPGGVTGTCEVFYRLTPAGGPGPIVPAGWLTPAAPAVIILAGAPPAAGTRLDVWLNANGVDGPVASTTF